jgi:competence protein ComEA
VPFLPEPEPQPSEPVPLSLEARRSGLEAEPLSLEAEPSALERGGRVRAAVEGVLPAALRGARVDPGRRGVMAIVVLALVAAALAGFGAWRARPTTEPLAAPVPVDASPSGAAPLVVAVAGKVRRPGVVRLPGGSRVADAVAAAGGALPGADLTLVNLARKVVDGEQIVIGVPAPAAPLGGGPQAAGGLVNLNTATLAQFDALPGVGPVLAQRLVEYRTANGGFRSVDQLRDVDGIGESRFQRLKDLVTA